MLGKLVSSLKNTFEFNHATLSGCADIIVVSSPSNSLKSTPFHVRFGIVKLLRPREKFAYIYVNGQETGLKMCIGNAGEAYFLRAVEKSEVASTVGLGDLKAPCGAALAAGDDKASPKDENESHPLEVQNLSKTLVSARSAATHIQDGFSSVHREKIGKSESLEDEKEFKEKDEKEDIFGSVKNARISFSLCGHLLLGGVENRKHDEDVFNANIIDFKQTNMDALIWFNPFLFARFDGKQPYFPAKVALPLIASWILFNKPLEISTIQTILNAEIKAIHASPPKNAKNANLRGYDESAGLAKDFYTKKENHANSTGIPSCSSCFNAEEQHEELRIVEQTIKSEDSDNISRNSNENINKKTFIKTLKPTSKQLESLKLRRGANRITFSVFSSNLIDRKNVEGTIYLWESNSRIVVSDVDGTVTKSDLLGQIFPIIGKDCIQRGIAGLFSKIKQANFKFLYLTARAIGQADSTRDVLFSYKERNPRKDEISNSTGVRDSEYFSLPDGPLVMSPDRLFPSFKREVIDSTPYVFKIAALRDIRNLFPLNFNPFFSGFGNRESDYRAYVHIGIPEDKIFIVNTKGDIQHINHSIPSPITYEGLSEIVSLVFSPQEETSENSEIEDLRNEEEAEDELRQRKLFRHTLYIDDGDEITSNAFCGSSCNAAIQRKIPIII